MSRRTFYKYFQNKEQVLAALYQMAMDTMLASLRTAQRAASSRVAALRSGIRTFFDFHLTDARLLRVLVEEALRSESPLAPLRDQFRDHILVLFEQAADEADCTVDRALGVALVSSIEGLSLDLLRGGRPERHDVNAALGAVDRLLTAVLQDTRSALSTAQ